MYFYTHGISQFIPATFSHPQKPHVDVISSYITEQQNFTTVAVKLGAWTSNIRITWECFVNICLVVSNPLNKKLQRWGPAMCVFIRLPSTCDYLWKFENHCSKNWGKTIVHRVLKKALWRETISISYCLTVYIVHKSKYIMEAIHNLQKSKWNS